MARSCAGRTLLTITAGALIVATLHAPAAAMPPFEPEALEVRRCVVHADLVAPAYEQVPVSLRDVLSAALADERLHRVGLGASVWIEGYGEVIAVNPDLRLRPASNQKILTAVGALELLGADSRLRTVVAADGLLDGGVLRGDLYLIGGGDPTLARSGEHSLEALAEAVAAAGIRTVSGSVVVDESRYDTHRRANGWTDPVSPTWVGSLSALMVDENRYRIEASFLADPTTENARLFAEALTTAGVAVASGSEVGSAPDTAVEIVSMASPPVSALVALMLTDSNNTIAEMLVKEVGHRVRGIGSTAAGLEAMAAVTKDFCMPKAIMQLDGSGLSHSNARSARNWRRLVMASQSARWFDELINGLAVAGETGTLRWRFRDTPAAGNLRAKTGTISGVRSLTGTMITAGNRRVFFSFIVDHDEPRPPMAAIDDLLAAVAADQS